MGYHISIRLNLEGRREPAMTIHQNLVKTLYHTFIEAEVSPSLCSNL